MKKNTRGVITMFTMEFQVRSDVIKVKDRLNVPVSKARALLRSQY